MTYRKFRADYLFTGREMAGSDAVLVTTGDGTVLEILPSTEVGEGVEYLPGLLSPGFINCHCHLELSHMKGLLPERTGLVDFLLAVMQRRNTVPAGVPAGVGSPKSGGSQRGGSPTSSGSQDGNSASANTSGSQSPAGNAAAGGVAAETAGFILDAIAAAETAMLNDGIVAVGDICNTTHTLAQKTEGRLSYHNFIETMGFLPDKAADRLEFSRKVYEAFAKVGPASLVPHAPYSVSPPLFELIAGFPGNHLLTIHNQESEAENEFYLSGRGDFLRLYGAMGLDTSFFTGTGKRSLESYLPYLRRGSDGPGSDKGDRQSEGHGGDNRQDRNNGGQDQGDGGQDRNNGGQNQVDGGQGRRPNISSGTEEAGEARSLILVHNVVTNEEDLRMALNAPREDDEAALRLFFCLCPNANLYIGGKLPDVDLMIRQNCPLVIGTDSLASNHQLSILEELKTLQLHFPQLPTPTLLQWATANGAEALGMGGHLGDFHPGKRPGLVLIEGLEGGKFAPATRARRVL